MRVFEVLFIIAPNVEESDAEALINQLSDVITNQGATIDKLDRMGRRHLAYPIKKNNTNFRDGYYVVFTIKGTGAEIAEIERRMRVTDIIIRFLTIRIDEDLKRAEKFRSRRAKRVRPPRTTSMGGGRRGPVQAAPIPTPASEEEEEE